MRIRPALIGVLLLQLCCLQAVASTQEELAKAAQQKRIVFLIMIHSQPPSNGIDRMREMVREVAPQVENATIVEIDRALPDNAELIAKHKLAGAPSPLVLLVGRNGLIAGGVALAQATPERILALVPSPKKEEVLQALDEKKIVFIEVGRKGMGTREAAHAACQSACHELAGTSQLVAIDLDDPKEKGFLTQLGVDAASTEPVTVVMNAAGQITGNYSGETTATALVAAARKRVGCCPTGSGSSCAPPK